MPGGWLDLGLRYRYRFMAFWNVLVEIFSFSMEIVRSRKFTFLDGSSNSHSKMPKLLVSFLKSSQLCSSGLPIGMTLWTHSQVASVDNGYYHGPLTTVTFKKGVERKLPLNSFPRNQQMEQYKNNLKLLQSGSPVFSNSCRSLFECIGTWKKSLSSRRN